jgi:hypothetical protein
VNPLRAAQGFETPGRPLAARRIGKGAGHIHQTFRVACEHGAVALQRLNSAVFPDLGAVMANISAVTAHLEGKEAGHPDAARRVLRFLPAREGGLLRRDEEGIWRCARFIEGGRMPAEPATARDARAAAQALGRFLAGLADLPLEALREPLPGFHDTRARFEAFRAVADGSPESDFALSREPLADALASAGLPLRPVHNDTKLANVLLDAATGEGLCVLDLDTVMPGLSAHDFGDLARSAAFDAAEDAAEVRLDLNRLKALATGYLEGAGGALSAAERASFGLGARVIAYELGLRFLTDHLCGDRYFAVARRGQNLDRARGQFARLRALEAQAERVDQICGG